MAPATERTSKCSDMPNPAMIFVGATMQARSPYLSWKGCTAILHSGRGPVTVPFGATGEG